MFIGLIFVSFSGSPYLALFGFFIMGGGTAVLFPLAVSAAAKFTLKNYGKHDVENASNA